MGIPPILLLKLTTLFFLTLLKTIAQACMLLKTVAAMEQIDQNYSYDFFVRTNIGTFWDFNALLLHLHELPNTLCYSGHGPHENSYLSGTDTIVNRHMIQDIVVHRSELDYVTAEDKAMGLFFHGRLGAPFLPSRIFFLEHIESYNVTFIRAEISKGVAEQSDHFRVKNMANRHILDIACYVELCDLIYNLSCHEIEFERNYD